MNRLLFDEAIESNRLRKNSFLLILCLLILPSLLFSQIERNSEKIFLNGFGRYIFVDNQIPLFSLFSFDVDIDGIVDIGGLDETGKFLYIYYGKGFNQFNKPVKYSLGSKFTGVIAKKLNIDSRPNLILYSKIDGLIKIYAFNQRNISLLLTLQVDCCFSDINVVNLNKSPELEIVLSGSNFKGIGIITFQNYQYTYKKIDNETYSKLIPFYLNSDEKIDFVGFNALTKEVILLRNNSTYNYSKNVYKKFDENFDELLSGNFDDDVINDLALISNETKSIYVLFGNGYGGFSNYKKLRMFSNHTTTLVFDTNRDLIDDFLTYNKLDKKLYLKMFADDYNRLVYQPLTEIEKLYSLGSYRTTTTKGIAVSSNQGLFLIVYSSLSFKSEKFALSSKPSDLITLRLEDELYPRILFIDNEINRLFILSRNEFNAPQEILALPISYSYEKIKILSLNKNEVNLVCFKPYLYHFDYFKVNLKTGKYIKENLTVDGNIIDIGLEESTASQLQIDLIVESKNDLRAIVIKPFEVNKIVLNEKIAPTDFINYTFDFSNRELISIEQKSNTGDLILSSKKFNQSYKASELNNLTTIKGENYLLTNLTFCNLSDDTKIVFINLIKQNDGELIIVPLNKPNKYFSINGVKIEDLSSCKCKSHSSISLKSFSFYNEKTKAIEKIVFRAKGKPMNVLVKHLPNSTIYSIDYTLKQKEEIVYLSNYSIINIEYVEE